MATKLREFTLTRKGVEVGELTTVFEGRRKTFVFPHPTDDPHEIEYLVSRGAKGRAIPKSRPFYKPYEPLKGGE